MKNSLFKLFNRPSFHNPIIDGVRALGLIMVLFGHLLHFHSPLFTSVKEAGLVSSFGELFRADLAVDAFFVISGFLIGSILLKEYKKNSSLSFKNFYLRRFLRLAPVYFVSIILGVIFYHLIKDGAGEKAGEIEKMIGNFWTNLLYVNNFIPIQEQFMGWCWSLAVEEQFYILVPIFIVLVFKKVRNKVRFFMFLLILSSLIRFWTVYHFNLIGDGFWGDVGSESWRKTFSLLYDNLYTRYGGLLVGVIGSYLYIYCLDDLKAFFNNLNFSKFLFYLFGVVFVCIFLKVDFIYFAEFTQKGIKVVGSDLSSLEKIYFSFIVSVSRNLFSISIMYIVFYLMLTSHGSKSVLNRVLSAKFLFPIAQLSYSVYLIHPIVMIPVFRFSTDFLFSSIQNIFVVFLINSLISVSIMFFLAFLLYLFVERPFMEARNSSFFKRFLSK